MSDELVLTIDPPYIGSAVSPEVDITETDTTYTVDITDFRGVHSYTVEKTDQAIADAEQAATNANTAASQATATANAAAQYARDTADQAAADAQETADAAAGRADTAAASATQATQSANTAAGTANTAASNADAKAALADSKAALANTAATTANQAAQAAEAAKTAANTAAGQATTAAGTANTAASNADAKAALADTAAANADTATQAANTATTNATNAAQAANNAADVAIEAAEDMPKLVNTASGTTAQTVSDAWPTTPESAVLYGKSVQNGTPAPENPVPVQVVSGTVNLQIGETVTPIDLQGHTLAGGDVLKIDSAGRVWIEQRAIEDDLGALVWAYNSGFKWFYNRRANAKTPSSSSDVFAISNMYLGVSRYSLNDLTVNNAIAMDTAKYLLIRDSRFTDPTEFRASLTGVKAYYELDTPQTIELGTIELPELTNPCELAIYASLDPEWAISYEQDPNIVVTALQSSIAPVEGGTASTNYAVNSYLIHGNQLYRVTSAIATGEAITPGTNCVACTVMGEVIRLTA